MVRKLPTFIDWHKTKTLSDEEKEKLQGRIAQGEPDRHGVIDRGIVLDENDKRMYCILEAPDEEAVRKHHADAGIAVETVHRADVLL